MIKVFPASLFTLLISVSADPLAAEELALSQKQIQTLGIATSTISASQPGVIAGIPAQVVIPGNQMFIVSTPLPAMVEQTLVGVGDHVGKGQPLARLQSPALAEAQRGLLQASTQQKLAKDNLARDEQLWKDGIISESRYRIALSQHTEAAAVLAERKQMLRLSGMSDNAIAQLESGGNLNSLLVIASPIEGVVLDKSVNAGQRLEAAMPLFQVAKLQPLSLEIQAPLASTQDIKIGAAVIVPGSNAKGKVSAIGQSLSNSNQTILIRALIHQGSQNLRPGQFVEASIATSAKGVAQWSIPNSALARVSGKSLVFVETANGFRAEQVSVLHEGDQNSLVSGNFNGGEKIAVRGISALKAMLMGIGGGE
ncbi:MAG TPA: efflux RND transporter periplasmic adaptor subunit [Gallionellaceae bacterium]|nr:efflux RND transporter periplasmic adaptor subunit [Gallionellaceae bacterium]